MNVHPLDAEVAERVETAFQFLHRSAANGLEWIGERKVVGGMADGFHAVFAQRMANAFRIDAMTRGGRRLEGEVDEVHPQFGHPFDLRDNVAPRMIHRSD